MKKLVILGCGGYGKTIEDVVLSGGLFDSIVFLDDGDRTGLAQGKCADFTEYITENVWFYPAFGNNSLRIQWIDRLIESGAQVATIVHPTAYVGRSAEIATGAAVLPHAAVNATAKVEKGCIINFGAVIDHDVTVKYGCHICINSTVKAYNTIPPLSKLEAGSTVLNNTFKQE